MMKPWRYLVYAALVWALCIPILLALGGSAWDNALEQRRNTRAEGVTSWADTSSCRDNDWEWHQ